MADMKGSVVLKPASRWRWVNVFRAWLESGHVAVVIHCDSPQQVRNVQKSATNFRSKNQESFWTHTEGTDLYLIRPEAIKRTAMEVRQEKNGVIYFYDSKNTI